MSKTSLNEMRWYAHERVNKLITRNVLKSLPSADLQKNPDGALFICGEIMGVVVFRTRDYVIPKFEKTPSGDAIFLLLKALLSHGSHANCVFDDVFAVRHLKKAARVPEVKARMLELKQNVSKFMSDFSVQKTMWIRYLSEQFVNFTSPLPLQENQLEDNFEFYHGLTL